jgi:hypothetical protein
VTLPGRCLAAMLLHQQVLDARRMFVLKKRKREDACSAWEQWVSLQQVVSSANAASNRFPGNRLVVCFKKKVNGGDECLRIDDGLSFDRSSS